MTSDSVDKRLRELRSQISDLGSEVDADRAGVAALMGGGVFLALIGAMAAYDYFTGKAGVWSSLGITSDMLLWVAILLVAVGLGLVARGIIVKRRGKTTHETELAALEQEYADLLEYKNSTEGAMQREQ
jgi:hypothetical protein